MNVDNVFDSDEKGKENNGDSNKLSLPSASKHTRFQQKIKNTPGNLTYHVDSYHYHVNNLENQQTIHWPQLKVT
jgi:hypothetical protein